LSSDNKYQKDEISELISKGRKQGYLLFEEIDKTFQEDADSEGNFKIPQLDGRLRDQNPRF